MIGLYLQEIMKPAPGSGVPDFQRIDYLTYDAVQARWEYVSLDPRAPIGIMFARGFSTDPARNAVSLGARPMDVSRPSGRMRGTLPMARREGISSDPRLSNRAGCGSYSWWRSSVCPRSS
ncbi:hypothetical protein Anae109_3250 [Anaeromyxobacter sp. Fw109-5]|nr:hypothetical protein Anae109_3250 [Anaeromyxobacter sp. Fw109-5]